MTAPGGFVAGDVLGAADMNALPAGVMGYAQATSAQTAINTVVDVTSLTVTWTAVSTRRYRTSFYLGSVDVNRTSSSPYARVLITDGSNTQKAIVVTQPVAATVTQLVMVGSVVETSLSGSTTRKLRALMDVSAGVGTFDINGSTDNPAYILVEDIGPA